MGGGGGGGGRKKKEEKKKIQPANTGAAVQERNHGATRGSVGAYRRSS